MKHETYEQFKERQRKNQILSLRINILQCAARKEWASVKELKKHLAEYERD